MISTTELYIDGKFVPSRTGETFEIRNPYSGEVIGLSASASSADCKAAIDLLRRPLNLGNTALSYNVATFF